MAHNGFRFGHKLAIVLLLSCVTGFIWAMMDLQPWEREPSNSPGTREKPAEPGFPIVAEKEDEKPLLPDLEPEPVKEPEKPAGPDSAPPPFSATQLDRLFQNVRKMASKAEYDAASEELAKVEEIQIEQKERRAALRGWKSQIHIYQNLVRETHLGRIIPMPMMTRLEMKNGGKIIARTLTEEGSVFRIEDIRGIRSRINRTDVERATKMEPHTAFWEIWETLKAQCAPWGIEAKDLKEDNRFVFRFEMKKGRTVSGERFFRLADFCVSNGVNRLVTILLEEALKRDRNLLKKVHEKKGERLVSLLFYFLSIPSPADAEYLLRKVLQPRYSDTSAFRERLQNDRESLELLSKILEKPVELETEPEEDPAPKNNPVPKTTSSTAEKLPEATPDEIQKTVLQGDRFYREGMKHLLQSDPARNPENWGKENQKALDLFRKAATAYATAQEAYPENEKIPQALLDRFRDTQIRMSLCRKRGVSNR